MGDLGVLGTTGVCSSGSMACMARAVLVSSKGPDTGSTGTQALGGFKWPLGIGVPSPLQRGGGGLTALLKGWT